MSSPRTGHCDRCAEPATKWCPNCFEGVDVQGEIATTYYCSKECQKASFAEHKSICRDTQARTQLFRGGELLQSIFYEFREATFDLEIDGVKTEGDKIVLTEPWFKPNEGPLYNFPNHLISDLKVKNALLAYISCCDALAYLHEIMKKVFKGIVHSTTLIREGVANVKPTRVLIERRRPDGSIAHKDFVHKFIWIELKNGEQYAIDLAGAQYGQHHAVLGMREYSASYLSELRGGFEFGHEVEDCKLTRERQRDGELHPGFDHRLPGVLFEISKGLDLGMEKWEDSGSKDVVNILNAKRQAFEMEKDVLLSSIKAEMHRHIPSAHAGVVLNPMASSISLGNMDKPPQSNKVKGSKKIAAKNERNGADTEGAGPKKAGFQDAGKLRKKSKKDEDDDFKAWADDLIAGHLSQGGAMLDLRGGGVKKYN